MAKTARSLVDVRDLGKVGLTPGEVRVYDALLSLGETTRAELAKKSGISPSKIYDIANRLQEKGIVSSVKKQGVLHFCAADPSRLKEFLKKKEKDLAEEQHIVDLLLPSLIARHQETHEDVDVEVFYGWDGLLTAFLMLENSMGKGDESLAFGASVGKDPDLADAFFRKHQQRVEQKGYKVRIIFNEDMRARAHRHSYYDNSKRHEIRYLHQKTLTELYIYKEHVLSLILLKKPIAISIKNAEAVDAFRKFFETMWKEARK
jgi:predicted transcriptional regulator